MKMISIYNFGELSAEGRNTVKNWYLGGLDLESFEKDWADSLEAKLPESYLAVRYSKATNRANIYGTMNRIDLVELVRENLTPDEYDELKAAFSEKYSEWAIFDSHHACDAHDYTEGATTACPRATLSKFNRLVCEAMANLCREIEADGYTYFYEIADSDLEKWCNVNFYEFLENGELYE